MTIAFTERSYSRIVSGKLALAGVGSGRAPRRLRRRLSRSAEPSAASQAGFAAAADRVCRETKTHRWRIAGLRKLRPPADARDLYQRWLSAERLAVGAADGIEGRKQQQEKMDPLVQLAIAQGKIAGYAGRLGARACAGRARHHNAVVTTTELDRLADELGIDAIGAAPAVPYDGDRAADPRTA